MSLSKGKTYDRITQAQIAKLWQDIREYVGNHERQEVAIKTNEGIFEMKFIENKNIDHNRMYDKVFEYWRVK